MTPEELRYVLARARADRIQRGADPIDYLAAVDGIRVVEGAVLDAAQDDPCVLGYRRSLDAVAVRYALYRHGLHDNRRRVW